jgi:NAD(P)-dependent dehydrogenase (short-subunit alcohol dehydrogenase family)
LGDLRLEEVDVLLENKNAVIYGGGGSIGGAVARAFARKGARVFLAGRTPAKLEAVAGQIRSAGGAADTAEVDALDEHAVDEHAAAVAADAGDIDISFNLIAHPYTHGTPLTEMAVDDFMAPIETAARTTFLTARAAARHMVPRRSGVILAFGRPGDRSGPLRDYYLEERRLPSTRSRQSGGSSPSSSDRTECASSRSRAEGCPSRSPRASKVARRLSS